ncbi:MAG: Rne/Rng family ribonuclease [Desulfobulbaceae bacterium]|nr:Rne/Rng family ribonuclease [Desulfobulbaceae bacterium]
MAENTTKLTNQKKSESGKGEDRSVISRIGKWLTGQKDNKKVEQEDTKAAPVAAPENQAVAADGQEKKPGRPRKRGGRRRSGRGKRKENGAESLTPEGAEQTGPDESDEPEELDEPELPEPVETAAEQERAGNVKRKLLINTDEPEECRIALIENGRVEAFYVETVLHTQTKGNIYKGRIVSIEPSLQAVFIDIGEGKNGFLSFNDIHPEYFRGNEANRHWKDLDVTKALRKGDEMLVQVVKEAVGNKGASMTTFLSLPGRYLVLMPGSDSAGISRKIESESQREKLRSLIDSLELPEGVGYIVRTASKDITKTTVSEDLRYLLNHWAEIKERGQKLPSPSLIYKEQDIISRFLRDQYTPDIQEILVDNEDVLSKVQSFLERIPGRKKTVARLHAGTQPIFNNYQVEKQIEQIFQASVNLPSGGSIVITPTEALVAIDVNSGRTSKDKNFEESIFLANMEAAEEMARQLRLRDLGGLIVVDFIDMREAKHVREVEKKVKLSMKPDRAKVDISRISKFGLMQISRQKLASPVQRGTYHICEHCQGRGMVRSLETLVLVYLRRIQTVVVRREVKRIECRLPLAVAQYLLNKKRAELAELEGRYEVAINIVGESAMAPDDGQVEVFKI